MPQYGLQRARHCGLRDEPDDQRRHCDTQLRAAEVEGEALQDAQQGAGAAAALPREPFDAVAIDGDERELGSDEEASDEDQEQDGEQAERGGDVCRLLL